jgi:hypothetical protein
LLLGAWFFVGVGLVAPLSDFDDSRSDSGQQLSHHFFAVAALLFILSGPVAYSIGRRRRLFALPGGLLIVWGLWIAIAAVI